MPKDHDVNSTTDDTHGKRSHMIDIDSDDESRLFPTSRRDRSYQDSVAIVPGSTFKTLSKPSPKSFSVLKPVDRISRNARGSGPVRSADVQKLGQRVRGCMTSIVPTLSRPFSKFQDSERPAKRQRRDSRSVNSDKTSHSVIDLVGEDDEPITQLSSPTIAAALVPRDRDSSLSPSLSHRSGGDRKRKDTSKKVNEFRSLEKLVKSKKSRRRNSPDKGGMDPIEIYDDFPKTESPSMDHSKPWDAPNEPRAEGDIARASIETGDPVDPNKSLASEEGISDLRNRFVSTDGRRRTEDSKESPDELQGDVTVESASSALASSLRKSPFPKPDSPVRANRGTSPSDIRPTQFLNRRRLSPTTNRKIRSRASQKITYGLSYVRSGSFSMSAVDGIFLDLVFDQDRESFALAINGEESLQVPSVFGLNRISMVRHGPDDCSKAQLRFTKAEGENDGQAELEFSSPEEKASFFKLLETNHVRFLERESDWMNKVFERAKKMAVSTPNPGKRSSLDAVEEPVFEEKTEYVKRPKLSASMQDDNGVVRPVEEIPGFLQPPRRPMKSRGQDRSSPALVARERDNRDEPEDRDNGVSIPVKKYVPESLEGRATRSRSRRGLITLISEDGDAHQQSEFMEELPKWSKPLLYPREGKRRAEVDAQDLERLRDGEFLNDNLIGFYLRFLEHHLERKKPDVAHRVYFFNTYFFATLTNTTRGKRINYEGVEKWTRNVDIFSHDYIVVPINENAHWYVAIICNLPSLRRTLEHSQEPEDVHVQEPSSKATLAKHEVKEIPETPPPTSQEAKSPNGDRAKEVQISGEIEIAGEERTRQSFASMTLSDREIGNADEKESSKSEEWPAEDEKPSSPPRVFAGHDNTVASTEKDAELDVAHPKVKKAPAKINKSKRKSGPWFRRIDPDQPVIITFDSLDLPRASTINALREYLDNEASAKRSLKIDKTRIQGMRAREIPKQPNYSDCGLYLLAYVEKFVQNADDFTRRLVSKEMSATADWPPLRPGLLRRRLRDFLYRLEEEQSKVQRKEIDGETLMADEECISYLLGPKGPVEQQNEEEDTSLKENKQVLETTEEAAEDVVEREENKQVLPQVDEVVVPDSQPGDFSTIEKAKESAKDVEGRVNKKVEPLTSSPKSARVEGANLASRISPRQTRQSKHKQEEHSSTVSVVISDEPRPKTPDDKLIDDLHDMLKTPPKSNFEIQVPGTPPTRRVGMNESRRTSPRQLRHSRKRSS